MAERLISEMAVSDFSTLSSSRCTPPRKTLLLALFGVIALHDAHAAQRFGQPAGDFGVDFAALAEDGPDVREGLAAAPSRRPARNSDGDAGHQRADAQQNDQRDDGGHDAADELDQAGADQVAHAFHVGHDARDQHAGLVGVVIGHGQAADVRLHFAAQFGDQALRRLGQQLRQGKRGEALNDGGQHRPPDKRKSRLMCFLPMTLSMRYFVEAGKHQAGHAIDDHQHQADCEQTAPGANQLNDIGKHCAQAGFRGHDVYDARRLVQVSFLMRCR